MKTLFFGASCVWLSFFVGLCGEASAMTQGRVLAILVGNTNNPDLGKSVAANISNLETLLSFNINHDLQGKPVSEPVEVDVFKIVGSNFSCTAIEQLLAGQPDKTGKRLSVQPTDTVVFYYSGHGYHAEPSSDKMPTLLCSSTSTLAAPQLQPSKDLRLSDIMNRITALKPRFAMGIADACNTSVYVGKMAGAKGVTKASWVGLRSLFLGNPGKLAFWGAVAGTDSEYPNNRAAPSLFTQQLLNSLVEGSAKESPNWADIAAAASAPIDSALIEPPPSPPFVQRPQFDDFKSGLIPPN
jgi:hypothetical protein